jgi:MoaA/NifB/PqqE/SkfB family radical SAM enzyme
MGPLPDPQANFRAFQDEIEAPRRDGATSNTPLLLVIEPTTRCNFRCAHCSQSFTKIPPADMAHEVFQSLIPAMKGAHDVYLFGDGEALLDVPRHLAMAARVHSENPTCWMGFSTNGKLLTPEVYQLYAAAGIGFIQVSVDAATRESYETLRRGGSFAELLANLEGIADLRRRAAAPQPQLRLATVISRENYRELPGLAALAERYGFSDWYVIGEYPHNPGRDLLQLGPDDLAEVGRMREALTRDYGARLPMRFDPSLGLPGAAGDNWLEADSPVYCTVPWQRLEVKADGSVKVCPYYFEPICSMNGRTFAEVWNGEEFRRVRRSLRSGRDLAPYCAACRLGMRRQYLKQEAKPRGWMSRLGRWIGGWR